MYFDYQSQEIQQISSKTKCQHFKCCFSEVDDRSPLFQCIWEGVADPHSRRLTRARVVVRSKRCGAGASRLVMAGAGTPDPVSTAPRQLPSSPLAGYGGLAMGLGMATYFPALASPLPPWTRPCTC